MYFVQRNELDLKARILKITAWNESFSNRISIREYCSYEVHKDNPQWTCFNLQASLEVKTFFGFESLVEKLAVKLYSSNLHKVTIVVNCYHYYCCGGVGQGSNGVLYY